MIQCRQCKTPQMLQQETSSQTKRTVCDRFGEHRSNSAALYSVKGHKLLIDHRILKENKYAELVDHFRRKKPKQSQGINKEDDY